RIGDCYAVAEFARIPTHRCWFCENSISFVTEFVVSALDRVRICHEFYDDLCRNSGEFRYVCSQSLSATATSRPPRASRDAEQDGRVNRAACNPELRGAQWPGPWQTARAPSR